MKRINHALIMAAGRGMRMLPLTDEIPKAMAEVDGNSLIYHGIDKLMSKVQNIQIHITVGYKKAMLASHVIEKNISSVINTEGKGNAWWIFNSLLRNLNEPILVLTCDNITDLNIELILNDYVALSEPACMIIPVTPIKGLEGDFIEQENNLVKSLSRETETDIYCSGIQVLNPTKVRKLVAETEDFNKIWETLILHNELKCSRIYPDNWFAIDTINQLEQYKGQINNT
jgi:NDP-sugar pyrophosphorylase family protein